MESKQPWEPMALIYVGQVADVVQQGTGKSPIATGDPGEMDRKPPGEDM